jgi:hypothetical protein
MALYDTPNLTAGIDDALISTAQQVPALPIGILIFTFLVVLLGGTSTQQRRQSYSDFPFWALMASVSCLLLSLIMTMKEGMLGLDILGVVIALNIMTGFWFFLSKGRNEVQ